MKRGGLLLVLACFIFSLAVFVIAENSEGNASESRMFGRFLNHTNWDGAIYNVPHSIAVKGAQVGYGCLTYGIPAIVNGSVYFGCTNGRLYQINASNVSQDIESVLFAGTEELVSSPVIVNGSIYVGSYDKTLYQLNASLISQIIAIYNTSGPILTMPAVANGFVYLSSYDNRTYQLNASNVSQRHAQFNTTHTIASSPAVANGFVYVGSNNTVYQLNASNVSQLIFSYSAGNSFSSSPAVYNGFVYIINTNSNVYQLNASNVSQNINNYNIGGFSSISPAIWNGFVYTSGAAGILMQLNASNVTVQIANYSIGFNTVSSPVVSDGYVYVGNASSAVYQLNASNVSQFIGKFDTGSPVLSSLAVANGFVYVSAYDGAFYQLNSTMNLSKIEFTAPQVNITSPTNTTYTSSTVLVNITLNEAGNCNYTLNGVEYNLTNASSSTEFTGTMSSLSGSYSLFAICYDSLENGRTNQNITFSVVIPSTSSDSSGGGGGGELSKSYQLTDSELTNGYTNYLKVGDKYKFKISNENHTLTLNSLNSSSAKVTIQSTTKIIWLTKDNENKIDVDDNGINDLLLIYQGLSSGKATIYAKAITSGSSTGQSNSTNQTASNNQTAILGENNPLVSKNNLWLWIIGIILVLLIAGFGIKKYKENNQA